MNLTTVIFDMGGTLEDVRYDTTIRRAAMPRILDELARAGISISVDFDTAFDAILLGNRDYKTWSEKTEIELPSLEIWSAWNLRDFNAARVALEPIAEELSFLWETTFFSRALRPDAAPMLEALRERGYRLGVISNTSSRTQVFRTLEDYGIAGYFEDVTLSSIEGFRKPARAVFDSAIRKLNVLPDCAVYVGDTLSRDVIGAKRAGYALAIHIQSFLTSLSDSKLGSSAEKPDYRIAALSEIPGILDREREGRSAR